MEHHIDNSLLEQHADNVIIRKRLAMRKDVTAKPNEADMTGERNLNNNVAKDIKTVLSRSDIDFHRPGRDIEHKSSCIMSAHLNHVNRAY